MQHQGALTVYALERVAGDSARHHPAVMEVLTAFVREHSHEPWPPPDSGGREPERSTRPDVQAALTVAGRRGMRSATSSPIDLTGTDLARADLHGVNFTRADLGGADLGGADLGGAYLTGADLHGADLGRANLTGAHFIDARWPDQAAVPGGWKVNTATGRLATVGTDCGPAEVN